MNEEAYISIRNRIADMEKRGDVITMGTLVDEIERNIIIEAAKSNIKLGANDDFVIKFLMMNLELSEEEAKEVFKGRSNVISKTTHYVPSSKKLIVRSTCGGWYT